MSVNTHQEQKSTFPEVHTDTYLVFPGELMPGPLWSFGGTIIARLNSQDLLMALCYSRLIEAHESEEKEILSIWKIDVLITVFHFSNILHLFSPFLWKSLITLDNLVMDTAIIKYKRKIVENLLLIYIHSFVNYTFNLVVRSSQIQNF